MMAAEAVASETTSAEFGILGPLEVRRSGRAVPLGGPRQRAVLALLLLEANRVVSMDRLAEDVWGGDPPEGWATTLQTYVFHLRQALEPDRSRGAAGGVLVTRDRGYLLRVDREHLDASAVPGRFYRGAGRAGSGPVRRSGRDAAQGAGSVAQSGAGRPGRLRIHPARGGPAGGAAAGRAGGPDRRRPGAGPARRAHRRAGAAGRRASAAGAIARPADAGAVPLRPAGRGARRLPAGPRPARR